MSKIIEVLVGKCSLDVVGDASFSICLKVGTKCDNNRLENDENI